jgi:hypothetical protein
MPFLKTCRTCAVPVQIGKLYTWNSNGTITPKRDPGHRMLFYECKHLDRLFAGIEDLIGMSIERQIIESKSRSVIQYIKNERWWPRGALARSFVRPIVKGLTDGAIINGYGLIEVRELHWRKGYLHCQVTEPYSLPLLCGDISGAFESVLHKTNTVEYEQTGPGRYDLKCFWAPHAPELADRLLPRDATAKPGDLEHVRCGARDLKSALGLRKGDHHERRARGSRGTLRRLGDPGDIRRAGVGAGPGDPERDNRGTEEIFSGARD